MMLKHYFGILKAGHNVYVTKNGDTPNVYKINDEKVSYWIDAIGTSTL